LGKADLTIKIFFKNKTVEIGKEFLPGKEKYLVQHFDDMHVDGFLQIFLEKQRPHYFFHSQ
jgi:hypothetical protein